LKLPEGWPRQYNFPVVNAEPFQVLPEEYASYLLHYVPFYSMLEKNMEIERFGQTIIKEGRPNPVVKV
jgi:hypothetical protein